ncbi:MAG: hypothetical protein ABJC10_02310 [Acidobacteriota bacterium]
MSFKRLAITAVSLACLLGSVHAQPAKSQTAETGLVLEITIVAGSPPAYLPVRRSSESRSWAWYGRFGRLPGWRLPDGDKPIYAVRISPYFEEDSVRINVSVMRGGKFYDTEDQVATCAVRENEKVTIDALKDFGVEPFEIKVIRVAPQTSELPAIENKTKSVEVVGVEPLVSTFPYYKLTLRNLSDRNISALQVNIMQAGRKRLSVMPQGEDGQPLIKARDSGELKQPLSINPNMTPGGYAPVVPPAQRIVIESVMFADGSYEGSAEPAATFRAFTLGRKTELTRLLPLLENGTSTSPAELSAQLNAISVGAEDADVASLVAEFPEIKRERLQSPIETAAHSLRRELLVQLERFEKVKHAGDFQIWLARVKDRYSAWLSRLSGSYTAQR